MTPARSIHTSVLGTNQSQQRNPVTGLWKPYLTNHWTFSAYDDVRPASVKTNKSPSGWRPPQPWNHTSSLRRASFGHLEWLGSGGWYFSADGTLADLPQLVWPAIPDYVVDTALDSALLKLSNQEVQLGENFAEREQSNRMISSRVRQVAESIYDYKRKWPRDWATVKRLGENGARGIPNSWLETQYGWVPLLLDVKGVIDVMKHRDSDYDTFRVTVEGKMGDHLSKAITLSDGIVGSVRQTQVTRFFCKVRLDYVMDTPAYHQLQELNLVDPAAIAWNLLPYSFVVDWFLPVGNYLQELTADAGYLFKGGSISRYVVVETTAEPPYSTYGGRDYAFVGVTPAQGHNFSMTREVLSSSPAPRVPHFKNPLTLHHWANAMSLLVNAFR